MIRFNDIINQISLYNPRADTELIRKAYIFAAKVHEGQLRRSGEPYLVHPLEVSGILTTLKMDEESIATALLHDTLEDTNTTFQTLKDLFGEDIATLVAGLTKISKISFSSREERQVENFRKILVAMARDIRVIMIKLADRLHNMQTLMYQKDSRREDIAQETLDIYVPLSNRLGIEWLKVMLEDLSLKFLKPDIFRDLEGRMLKFERKRGKYIDEVKKTIKQKLGEYNIKSDVHSRFKNIYTIYKKMEDLGMEFDQIYDLLAFRVIVESVEQSYTSLGIIHSIWKPVLGWVKDYIALPKLNKYQSLHTTVIDSYGDRVEIQISTPEMDRIAAEGITADWKYKGRRVVLDSDGDFFGWLERLVEWQRDLKDSNEFFESVKVDLFPEDIYVFTPRGDLRWFSRGTTTLDFAYGIHTDIGHTYCGARVNGRIVPFEYTLRNGDTVEIITSPEGHPTREWLKLVKTTRAKSRIRSWLKTEERVRSKSIGREMLEMEMKKYDLSLSRLIKSGRIDLAIEKLNINALDDLLIKIGFGNLNPNTVIKELITPEEFEKRSVKEVGKVERFLKKAIPKSDHAVMVSGLEDALVHFGGCCNPLPGDQIIGLISPGQGVTVHTKRCTEVMEHDPERLVEVKWDIREKIERHVKIKVLSVDRPDLLSVISHSIARSDVNIFEARSHITTDKKAVQTYDLLVTDKKHLDNVIRSIEKVPGVIKVERL